MDGDRGNEREGEEGRKLQQYINRMYLRVAVPWMFYFLFNFHFFSSTLICSRSNFKLLTMYIQDKTKFEKSRQGLRRRKVSDRQQVAGMWHALPLDRDGAQTHR